MAIDISVITDQFLVSDILPILLIVVGVLFLVLAAVMASDQTLSLLRGNLRRLDRTFVGYRNEAYFKRKYASEQRSRQYRDWKRTRGF